LAPYRKSADGPVTPNGILFKNRKVTPFRLSLVLAVQFTHPNPQIAAKVANLFVDEYISNNSHMRIDESMKAVDDLKIRADQQKLKVEELGPGAASLSGKEQPDFPSISARTSPRKS